MEHDSGEILPVISIYTQSNKKPLTLYEHIKEWANTYFKDSTQEKSQPIHYFDSNARSLLIDDDINIVFDLVDQRNALKGEGIKLREIFEYIGAIVEHPLMNRKPWLTFSGLMIGGLFLYGFYLENHSTKKIWNGFKCSFPMILLSTCVWFSFLR